MTEKLRILLLEDNASDAELIERQLKKAGIGFVCERVKTRTAFLQALKTFRPDLILTDYSLPKFNALQALALRKKNAPLTPFIIVTGSISEEIAVECMKDGADDYLLKDHLVRLGEAVRHSLTNRRLQVEKIAAEESLRSNELLYRTFIDSNTDMVFLKDSEFRHLLANQALCRFYGKAENKIIGKTDFDLMGKSAAAKCRRSDKQALAENKINVSEETVGGRTFETRKFPVKLIDGRIGVGSYIRDISDRKRTEEQIRASLLEKEVLLKEIHHRVKNNLQIISGLLTLQAAQINDERLQRMLKESQSRIWTMALIHQTLYQSGNLADIDMADYIRSLAGNLLSSYAQPAMPPTVSFDLVPVRLVIDKAIPLALIINELVTNAIKHAFPDGRSGEIRIALNECRDKACPRMGTRLVPTDNMGTARLVPARGCAPTYELTVADNGAGLPAGFDPKNQKSLGLQLVDMLTKQLGGSLAIESSGGTAVHIKFSNNEKNEKQS